MEGAVSSNPSSAAAHPMMDDSDSDSDSDDTDDLLEFKECELWGAEAMELVVGTSQEKASVIVPPPPANNATLLLPPPPAAAARDDYDSSDSSDCYEAPESARSPQHAMNQRNEKEVRLKIKRKLLVKKRDNRESNRVNENGGLLSTTGINGTIGGRKSKDANWGSPDSALHSLDIVVAGKTSKNTSKNIDWESSSNSHGSANDESSGGSSDSSDDENDNNNESGSEISIQLETPIRKNIRPTAKAKPNPTRAIPRRTLSKEDSGKRFSALAAFQQASKSARSGITEKETFSIKKIVRQTRKVDLETGVKATREFTAHRVVDPEFLTPMNPKERRKKILLRKAKEKMKATDHGRSARYGSPYSLNGAGRRRQNTLNMDDSKQEDSKQQYRLRSMIAKNDDTYAKSSFNIIREYLYWCFRKTFFMVVVTESVIFLLWCWIFAILYYMLGKLNPQCIMSHAGSNFEEANMGMVDAFTLSWTTFSTVGYGHIHPSVYGDGSSTGCAFVTVLASLESFVGVLSASFCSAVIFSKIARTQSIAHVIFSNTLVIRFGKELMQAPTDASVRDLDQETSNRAISNYPCPILEFRVVNLLHNEQGGEIMNCKLNVVASTLKEVSENDQEEDKPKENFLMGSLSKGSLSSLVRTLQDASKRSLSSGVGPPRKGGSAIQKMNRTIADFASLRNMYNLDTSDGGSSDGAEAVPYKEVTEKRVRKVKFDGTGDDDSEPDDVREGMNESRRKRAKSLFVDEEPSGGSKPASQRVFNKLELETDSHPFLKRVWNIRHRLTQDSPLLNEHVREIIRINGGLWPATFCNEEAIQECLEMTQLIVTLNGTNVASGSSVYKLHVYDPQCVMVGRTFENPLALTSDGKLMVDMNLVHTTTEQYGGNNNQNQEEDGDAIYG